MESEPRLRLTIEVEADDPLAGRIGEPGSQLTEFHGWLGLANQLDALLARIPRAEGRPGGDAEPQE